MLPVVELKNGVEKKADKKMFPGYVLINMVMNDEDVYKRQGITTVIAEDPLTAVAIGTGKFIEFAHGMTSALESSMGIGGGRNDKEDY